MLPGSLETNSKPVLDRNAGCDYQEAVGEVLACAGSTVAGLPGDEHAHAGGTADRLTPAVDLAADGAAPQTRTFGNGVVLLRYQRPKG